MWERISDVRRVVSGFRTTNLDLSGRVAHPLNLHEAVAATRIYFTDTKEWPDDLKKLITDLHTTTYGKLLPLNFDLTMTAIATYVASQRDK